jgi:hypothetical protein
VKIGTFVTGYPGSYYDGAIWQIVSINQPGFGLVPMADLNTLELLHDSDRKYAVASELQEFTATNLVDIVKEAHAKVSQGIARLHEWFGAGACPKT